MRHGTRSLAGCACSRWPRRRRPARSAFLVKACTNKSPVRQLRLLRQRRLRVKLLATESGDALLCSHSHGVISALSPTMAAAMPRLPAHPAAGSLGLLMTPGQGANGLLGCPVPSQPWRINWTAP